LAALEKKAVKAVKYDYCSVRLLFGEPLHDHVPLVAVLAWLLKISTIRRAESIVALFPRISLSPPRVLVMSFAVVILLGTVLLLMPGVMVHTGRELTVIDALFTSTSAVCVTGLTVRDTGTEFSFFGQAVVLVLIQMGGLGILTLSNLLLLARSGRVGLSGRMLIEESHGLLPFVSPARLLQDIVLYTFAVETLGTAILASHFLLAHHYNFSRAVWLGLFHAVSAFCNAGFGLFSNSLIGYSGDWVINITIMTLIVLGGIGFLVFADVRYWIRRSRHVPRSRLSLHSRVVLRTSLLLTAGGAALIFLLELTGKAMPESAGIDVLQSLFLAVTARTAGFNTVETEQLTNATLLIVMLLMVVGGSPGSTAGGIKTTTLATLWALLSSRVRNRPRVELLNRRLPTEVIAKALMTAAGFLLAIIVAVILLQITELFGQPHALHRGEFLEYLFETISALGTVGLSTGITGGLSGPGRLVITFCMFVGRLGPVLVAVSLVGRQHRKEYSYPEEELIVG
jgi:trk system potassium uptake protein TrkH